MRRRFLVFGLAALTLVAVVVACGSDDGDAEQTATEPPAATNEPAVDEVRVRLFEWSVDPAVDSVTAGSVTFNADNIGALTHELVILRTDIGPDALPTLEDGSADYAAEGIEVVAQFLDIGSARSKSGAVDMAPGSYVLICNIVDDAEAGLQPHYELGMVELFEVTSP